jgi:hypothetical protein
MSGLRSSSRVVSDPLPSVRPCRDCGTVERDRTLYWNPTTRRERAYLCDECRGAIALDAFACGEEDSLTPVFKK